MLTKEEREEIAEKLMNLKYIDSDGLYKSIIGKPMPKNTSASEDDSVILDRLIDLCDTSSMIELPLDKDGEIIRIGDTVYDNDGNEAVVNSLRYCAEYGCVVICTTCNGFICTYSGDELTHKKPVTIASIAGRIKEIASNDEDMSYCTSSELLDIADQLDSLGDNDD